MPALAIPPDLMEFLRSRDENMKPYLNSDVLVSCIEWFLQKDDGFCADHAQEIQDMLERKSQEIELRTGQQSSAKRPGQKSEETKPTEREAREAEKRKAETEREQKKPGKSAGRKPKESGKEASLKKLLTKSRKTGVETRKWIATATVASNSCI